jgi:GNAT superfamily N-acetyltransferase
LIVRRIGPEELPTLADALSALLVEQVDAGASLGFLPPLGDAHARAYWRSLGPELSAETRLLVAAFDGEALAGTGQLVLPSLPNARHRAEVQKVMVAARVQRTGVGRALMSALHEEARARGRSLLLLNT